MTKLAIYGLAALAILAAGAFYTKMVYEAGGAAVRAENLAAANASLKKMEEDNVEIRKLDTDAYCAEFGFEWLPEQGKCG